MQPRWRALPDRGTLLISTDLHGNGDDFRALREVFASLSAGPGEVHWVILGDVVHGPDERFRKLKPELYDYEDESAQIAQGILALRRERPDRVHFVLGNHDHGHVGGPHTSKFYPDEVAALESRLSEGERAALRELFEPAYLAVAAPCGVLLTHGSPDDSLRDLDELNDFRWILSQNPPARNHIVRALLTAYGQPDAVCDRMLASVSRPGLALSVVVHGHDRDEQGLFYEGNRQVCPVIFGALRPHKRYVVLDLAARYDHGRALRDGVEIRRLYP